MDLFTILHPLSDQPSTTRCNLTLNFTPDFHGRFYKLSEEGHEIDENIVIEDGHVNYDGAAWWRERTITEDIALIALSRGIFDFSERKFNGSWLVSTMEHAAYITFEAVEPSPSIVELSAPDGEGLYNVNVPGPGNIGCSSAE